MTTQTATTTPAANSKQIRWGIFLPPWLLVISLLALNLINGEAFLAVVNGATGWILENFSWLFNATTFVCVVLVIIAFFAPFSKVRFGGSKARPIMSQLNFVWIVLCTIMAAGILLWAAAEPMYHLYGPPAHIEAKSQGAIAWAMQTILLEWTFSPMAIYCVPAILFAFAFYNMKKDYSIGSMLYPALGENLTPKVRPLVDCICLFALVAGMAASLGSGVLLLAGGAESLWGIKSQPSSWIVAALVIVCSFIISAASGLMNGIRILSSVNSRLYLLLGAFVFICGPTAYIMDLLVESVGLYLNNFIEISLWTSTTSGDAWSRWWPTFYWCNWMAWMPVTSVFLGRLCRGYTVRDAITVIFIFPAIFSMVWLVLFSGTSINFEMAGMGINEARLNSGTEGATYALFRQLPLSVLSIPVFLLIVFVSFVTAADSNTNAMSGLCTTGLSVDDQESPMILKIVWGLTIGAMCLIMLIAAGIDGVKMASNLGGFPNVFLLTILCFGFVRVLRDPKKYDTFKEDYDENGRPIPSVRPEPEYGSEKTAKKHLWKRILLDG
ncbi:BCCT transporter [Deltaproteobacteria bacterium Smac51]|nr:BCCT transporter [Deltaproteobacteria bacterium Smac51]